MADLKDVLAHLLRDYPNPEALANARVTKMVYLADWKSALDRGQQVTGINWYFDNFGPFVHDVKQCAKDHPELFTVTQQVTALGGEKNVFALIDKTYVPKLTDDERRILDHVRTSTQSLSFDRFVKLVYSTFPVMKTERFSYLNLVELAKQKHAEQPQTS